MALGFEPDFVSGYQNPATQPKKSVLLIRQIPIRIGYELEDVIVANLEDVAAGSLELRHSRRFVEGRHAPLPIASLPIHEGRWPEMKNPVQIPCEEILVHDDANRLLSS